MRSIKENFIYNACYQVLGILVPLITTPYVSRILGPIRLGEYSYNYSIASYFVTFAMLGLNNYGNRMVASIRDNKRALSKTFSEIYCMQFLTSFFVVVLYAIYSFIVSGNSMSWVMLLYVLSAILDINWFFYGMEIFKLTVVRNVVIKLITTVFIFIFVKEQSDVYIYGGIIAGGVFVSQIILWPFVKRYVNIYKVDVRNVVKHLKPNLTLFIPAIAISIYKLMDKVMLGILAEYEEVGFYESAEKLIQIPNALIVALGTVMLPRMANLAAQKDKSTAESYLSKSFVFVMFLSSSMSFGIMAIADNIVPIFFGVGYEKCVLLIRLLLPSCMFVAFANVIRTEYLIPQKKDKIYIQSVFVGAGVNLVLNLCLIWKFASIGAVIGTFCAETAVCVFQVIKVRRVLDIDKYIIQSVPFLLAGMIMYIVLIQIHFDGWDIGIELILRIIIGGLMYLVESLVLILIMRFCRRRIVNVH